MMFDVVCVKVEFLHDLYENTFYGALFCTNSYKLETRKSKGQWYLSPTVQV
jgi:hypothetical protein